MIFLCILIVAVGYLLFLVNQNIQRVQSDVFNVKATVSEQQKNNLDTLESQLEILRQGDLTNVSALQPSLYVNRRLGIQFQVPVFVDSQDGLIEDNDVIMFGPLENLAGVFLPKYSLRIYSDQNIDDYLSRIRFAGEVCDPSISCLLFDFNFSEIDPDRKIAITKIVEPFDLAGFQAWKYSASDTCLIPTFLVYDQTNDRLFEFQENCSDDDSGAFEVLNQIVHSFTLLPI